MLDEKAVGMQRDPSDPDSSGKQLPSTRKCWGSCWESQALESTKIKKEIVEKAEYNQSFSVSLQTS